MFCQLFPFNVRRKSRQGAEVKFFEKRRVISHRRILPRSLLCSGPDQIAVEDLQHLVDRGLGETFAGAGAFSPRLAER